MLIKKSKNPYLNLVKSVRNVHTNTNLNISDKIGAYNSIVEILKSDLGQYKFYTHPAFNDKFYPFDSKWNTKVGSTYNSNNPWQLFLKNILKAMIKVSWSP